jgi:hypothetical protein
MTNSSSTEKSEVLDAVPNFALSPFANGAVFPDVPLIYQVSPTIQSTLQPCWSHPYLYHPHSNALASKVTFPTVAHLPSLALQQTALNQHSASNSLLGVDTLGASSRIKHKENAKESTPRSKKPRTCLPKETKTMAHAKRVLTQIRRDKIRESRMSADDSVLNYLEEVKAGRKPALSYRALEAKFGVAKTRIGRLIQGEVKFDGTIDGRPTLLSAEVEAYLLTELRARIDAGERIDGSELSRAAQRLYAQKPSGITAKVPLFGEEWRRSFNRRYPNWRITSQSAKAKKERRIKASTRSSVNHLLQGAKGVFDGQRENGDPKFHINARRVLFADETDITNATEGISAGKRALATGKSVPYHALKGDEPHLTAFPLISPIDGLVCISFILAGSPTVDPDFANPVKIERPADHDARSQLIYNKSGSCEKSDDDGNHGSFMEVVEFWIAHITARFGERHERAPMLIVLDGFGVHKETAALELLKSEGIEVMVNAPNATHIVQVPDHPSSNGKFQERIRARKTRVADTLIVPETLEQKLNAYVDIAASTFNNATITNACRDIGFSFMNHLGKTYMGFTDESISTTLTRKEMQGELRVSRDRDEDASEPLRLQEYILARKLVKHGILPKCTSSLVTENVIKATKLPWTAVREPRPQSSSVTAKRRRIAVSIFDEKKSGTYLATDPEALARARAMEQKKKAEAKAKEEKATLREAAKLKKADADQARKSRLEGVQNALPGIDLTPYKRSIGRYLAGSKTLEWALAAIERRRNTSK